jgi:hypothetical protein
MKIIYYSIDMGDKRICISKQVTFISLIFLLLLSYIVFAYWTSTNKTSTNSRASSPSSSELIEKVAPNDIGLTPENRITIATGEGDGTIQYNQEDYDNKFELDGKYEIYVMSNNVPVLIDEFINDSTTRTQKIGWTEPKRPLRSDETEFYFYRIN